MQLKSTARTEHDEVKDRVYAAMETGNSGQARTILDEYAYLHVDNAAALRSSVLSEYGIAL